MKCKDCGNTFDEEAHLISIVLDEKTTATVFFPINAGGVEWHYCRNCLEKNFQNHFDSLNPSQKEIMKNQLSKLATSRLIV